jgi:hypothetical protein
MPRQLPGTGPVRKRRERADAARNRQRLLDAAEELFGRRGAGNVTMEDIARAAGVGKGTPVPPLPGPGVDRRRPAR